MASVLMCVPVCICLCTFVYACAHVQMHASWSVRVIACVLVCVHCVHVNVCACLLSLLRQRCTTFTLLSHILLFLSVGNLVIFTRHLYCKI